MNTISDIACGLSDLGWPVWPQFLTCFEGNKSELWILFVISSVIWPQSTCDEVAQFRQFRLENKEDSYQNFQCQGIGYVIMLSKRYECISLLLWLSWERDMNVFHCFCERLYKCAYTASKPSTLFVYIFICLFRTIYFIGIQISNNIRKKCSKIPLDSA